MSTATSQTVALVDRVVASIIAGEGTIAQQWARLGQRERALFDSRADFTHAITAGLERSVPATRGDRFTPPGYFDPGGESVSFDLGGAA